MLTCKIENKKINVFETDEYLIREHSKKGSLFCGGCGERIIYNHGEIKDTIYLRHYRTESCSTEQETEEHENGKMYIYQLLKNNNSFTNVSLEHYIPETKQVADIYLEHKGQKIVIEYQCSPISTQLKQRNRKYVENGYKVFWIFGTKNYAIGEIKQKESCFDYTYRMSASEMIVAFEYGYHPLYFNSTTKEIIQINKNSITIVDFKPKKTIYDLKFSKKSLEEFDFLELFNAEKFINYVEKFKYWIEPLKIEGASITPNENRINLNASPSSNYCFEFINKFVDEEDINKLKSKNHDKNNILLSLLNAKTYKVAINKEYFAYKLASKLFFDNESNKVIFMKFIRSEYRSSYWGGYSLDVYLPTECQPGDFWIAGDNLVNLESSRMIFDNEIKREIAKEKCRLDKIILEHQEIYNRISSEYKDELETNRKEELLSKFRNKIGENINKKIIIHDGFHLVPNGIRFKLLKGVNAEQFSNESFIVNEFSDIVNHLFKISKENYIVLMLPRMKDYRIMREFTEKEKKIIRTNLKGFGFTKIKITGEKFNIGK